VPVSFASYRPQTVEDLLELLSELPPGAKLHAGGTDLMVHLKEAKIEPHSVVDLSAVEGLNRIEESKKSLVVGAMAPFSDLVRHPLLAGPVVALKEASVLIGSVQIRNRATLIGNICNASPAADTVPPLVVFGASAIVRSRKGKRSVPVIDFVTGPGTTVLESGEFVEALEIPVPEGSSGSAYLRMTRRRSVDLAIVDVAVLVTEKDVRVSYGAASARPITGPKTEAVLRRWLESGRGSDGSDREELEAAVADDIAPITDVRASREYRLAMAAVLAGRAYALAKSRRDESREGAK
jgi:CO/xanthine dehydrogenase FAD-binding subunit